MMKKVINLEKIYDFEKCFFFSVVYLDCGKHKNFFLSENKIATENIPISLLAQNLILLLQAYLYHYPMKLKSAENLMNCLKNML